MNKKMKTWQGAALLALLGLAGQAGATNTSSYLNIDVTFNTALSVAVDAVNSSTYTVPWTGAVNAALVSPTSATVTNDSGGITERWKLFTNQNSLAPSGSTWCPRSGCAPSRVQGLTHLPPPRAGAWAAAGRRGAPPR